MTTILKTTLVMCAFAALALLAMTGCIADTSTTEQSICTEDNPGCGTPLAQHTINRTYDLADSLGVMITATPAAKCNALSCVVSTNVAPSTITVVECFAVGPAEWCTFTVCQEVSPNSWRCNPAPPPD